MMRRRSGGHGSPVLGIFIIAVSFISGGYLWVRHVDGSQRQKIAYLEGLSSRLRSESVPLKFMILSREGGEIKARLRFYDLSGREVAVMEKSWPGSQLYVDMLLVPIRSEKGAEKADSWLAFPYRVFTDTVSAASGTLLFDTYAGSRATGALILIDRLTNGTFGAGMILGPGAAPPPGGHDENAFWFQESDQQVRLAL